MNRYLQVPRIMWGALSFSVVLFFGVTVFTQSDRSGMDPDPVMAFAFGGVSLVIAVVSFVLPKNLHQQALKARKLKITTVDASGSPEDYRQPATKRRVFADPTAARKAAVAIFQTPFILSLALSESIATFGLALGFMGFPMPVYGGFMALSLVLCLMRFPSAVDIIGPLEIAHDAKLLDKVPKQS